MPPVPALIETTASPGSYWPSKSASSCRRESSAATGASWVRSSVLERRIELEQLAGLLDLAVQPLVAVEPPGDAGVLGGDAGGALLVVPESGSAHGGFELVLAGRQLIGVKGTHEPSRAGLRAPRARAREVDSPDRPRGDRSCAARANPGDRLKPVTVHRAQPKKGGVTGNRRFPASGSARSAAENICQIRTRYALPSRPDLVPGFRIHAKRGSKQMRDRSRDMLFHRGFCHAP